MAHFEDQACTPDQTEIFFPVSETLESTGPARAICRQCPARFDCLDYALANYMVGIWGATTTEERKRLRRRRLTQNT